MVVATVLGLEEFGESKRVRWSSRGCVVNRIPADVQNIPEVEERVGEANGLLLFMIGLFFKFQKKKYYIAEYNKVWEFRLETSSEDRV